MHSAFPLLESVVVVLIVGILAAIAAPRMFDAAGDARDSALRRNLAAVRDAIELHKLRAGRLPGEAGTEGDLRADLGPFLQPFPPNPVKDSSSVSVKSDGTPFTGTVGGGFGWRYDSRSGEIIANSNGTAGDGLRYWEW